MVNCLVDVVEVLVYVVMCNLDYLEFASIRVNMDDLALILIHFVWMYGIRGKWRRSACVLYNKPLGDV